MNDEELVRELAARLAQNPSLVEELKKSTPVIGGQIQTGDIYNLPPSLRRALYSKMADEAGMGDKTLLNWEVAIGDVKKNFQDDVKKTMRRRPELSYDEAVAVTALQFVGGALGCVGFLLMLGMGMAIGEAIRGVFDSPYPLWQHVLGGAVGFVLLFIVGLIFKKTQ